jgi:hypothetical protein
MTSVYPTILSTHTTHVVPPHLPEQLNRLISGPIGYTVLAASYRIRDDGLRPQASKRLCRCSFQWRRKCRLSNACIYSRRQSPHSHSITIFQQAVRTQRFTKYIDDGSQQRKGKLGTASWNVVARKAINRVLKGIRLAQDSRSMFNHFASRRTKTSVSDCENAAIATCLLRRQHRPWPHAYAAAPVQRIVVLAAMLRHRPSG